MSSSQNPDEENYEELVLMEMQKDPRWEAVVNKA